MGWKLREQTVGEALEPLALALAAPERADELAELHLRSVESR
jgi:hypothetical protein